MILFHRHSIQVNTSVIKSKKVSREYVFVLVADLHGNPYYDAISKIKAIAPDAVLIPGDVTEDLTGTPRPMDLGLEFLKKCCAIAPTYYSLGNHECNRRRNTKKEWEHLSDEISTQNRELIEKTGARLLEDDYVDFDEIKIGGARSEIGKKDVDITPTDLAECMTKDNVFSILLCHHPEYYRRFLKETKVDLIVSGHAHGGHWRLFGRGLMAPGQGVLPRYTKGMYHHRLIVTAGLSNNTSIPRLFNPFEVRIIKICPDTSEK